MTTATADASSASPVTAPSPTAAATATATVAVAVNPADAGSSVRVEVRAGDGWFAVCALDALTPGRGVAALLPDGAQAAVFLDRAGRTYAIGNRDPFTGACVLSRGLLGSAGEDGSPFVASPLLKQRFDLRTGRCLDDGSAGVPVYDCRTARGSSAS